MSRQVGWCPQLSVRYRKPWRVWLKKAFPFCWWKRDLKTVLEYADKVQIIRKRAEGPS
jgi:hypothetical protein